jgi:hypothetical protein
MQCKWGGTKWGTRQRVSLSPFCLAPTQENKRATKKPFACVPIWFQPILIASATVYQMPLMHLKSDTLVIAPSVSDSMIAQGAVVAVEQKLNVSGLIALSMS